MRIGLLLLYFYGLTFTAHASILNDLGSSICSGSQSSDFTNGLSFSCSGDFSLSTGSISSDTSISVSALGSLSLDTLLLSAPNITLSAASIYIGPSSTLNGQNINISANKIVIDGLISPDSAIQILPGRDIIPPISLPSDATITLLPGGDISISGGTITTVPLPASFTMLLTGLLTLLSASRRSLFRKV